MARVIVIFSGVVARRIIARVLADKSRVVSHEAVLYIEMRTLLPTATYGTVPQSEARYCYWPKRHMTTI